MCNFTIIVDTRENLPYLFHGYTCGMKRSGLKTGDYSIEGYESAICIERKSKEDLYSNSKFSRNGRIDGCAQAFKRKTGIRGK